MVSDAGLRRTHPSPSREPSRSIILKTRAWVGRILAVFTCLSVLGFGRETQAQGRYAGRSPRQLVDDFRRVGPGDIEEVASAIFARRGESVAALRVMLATGNAGEREFACALLGELRDRNAVDSLLAATFDANQRVKSRALSALHRVGDLRALPRLRQLVQTEVMPGTLKRAMVGLGKMGSVGDVAALRPYLAHEDETVRVTAAGAMAMLGNGEGEDILLAATHSSTPAAQREATGVLGYLPTSSVRARLQEIVDDPNGAWKSYALIAQAIQLQRTVSAADRAASLETMARSGNRAVASWALDELSDASGPEATEAIRRLSTRPSRVGRRAQLRLRVKEAS